MYCMMKSSSRGCEEARTRSLKRLRTTRFLPYASVTTVSLKQKRPLPDEGRINETENEAKTKKKEKRTKGNTMKQVRLSSDIRCVLLSCPTHLSLNRLLNGIVSCSWCYFVQPIFQKFHSHVTDGRTDPLMREHIKKHSLSEQWKRWRMFIKSFAT